MGLTVLNITSERWWNLLHKIWRKICICYCFQDYLKARQFKAADHNDLFTFLTQVQSFFDI